MAQQQQGDSAGAVDSIGRAIALDNGQPAYYNNLGVALRALDQLEKAGEALQQAVTLNPYYADAHANLGLVLADLGRHDEAIASLQYVLTLQPQHADAAYNLANLLLERGQAEQAAQYYRSALQLRPGWPEALNNFGRSQLALGELEAAVDLYQQAIRAAPQQAIFHFNLGGAFAEMDRLHEARAALDAATRMHPDDVSWRLTKLTLCPTIFRSTSEIDPYWESMQQQLDEARRWSDQIEPQQLSIDGPHPSFNWAHLGRPTRPVVEKFARLFAHRIPACRLRPNTGKPKIGFVVTRGHQAGFLRTMAGVVRHLDRRRFDVAVLCSGDVLESVKAQLADTPTQWVALSDRLTEAVEQTAGANCSLLYHRKIGADGLNYLLPFARPAPIQCTSWGTHLTSGVPGVDYYLSSSYMEHDDADQHYTETLVRLQTIPSFERRMADPPPARRADFGLPDRGSLYLCPQRLAKFHPDQDQLLLQILDANPEAHVVILSGRNRYVLDRLLARFSQTLGRAADRIVVLPPQKPVALRQLLSLGDALLDMPHYSVSLMAYDAFAVNLPIVTLPGSIKLSRYALGFYRYMGIQGAVAWNSDQYVELALRLGTDGDFRQALRDEIGQNKEILFEDPTVVRQYERFFHEVLDRASS